MRFVYTQILDIEGTETDTDAILSMLDDGCGEAIGTIREKSGMSITIEESTLVIEMGEA